jgi:hypothetical protein
MVNTMTDMWIGPRGGELWFPAPIAGAAFTPVGWSSGSPTTYINGNAGIRRSKNTHMDYPMSWGVYSRARLSALRDMYTGARGPGLIYFIDPMAADLNVLPAQWAFPASAAYDATPLIGNDRPGLITTSLNQWGQPPESVQYALTSGAVSREIYIPIPPGYDAWFGVTGSISGTGGVTLTPVVLGDTLGTPVTPVMLAASSGTLVNTKISGVDYRGVIVSLNPEGTATSVTLTSMCMQILDQNQSPVGGNFIGGWGNSGCEFVEAPLITSISSVNGPDGEGQAKAACHLVEVGDGR